MIAAATNGFGVALGFGFLGSLVLILLGVWWTER